MPQWCMSVHHVNCIAAACSVIREYLHVLLVSLWSKTWKAPHNLFQQTTTRTPSVPLVGNQAQTLSLFANKMTGAVDQLHSEYIEYLNSIFQTLNTVNVSLKASSESVSHGYTALNRDDNGLNSEDVQFIKTLRRTFNAMLADSSIKTTFVHGRLTSLYNMTLPISIYHASHLLKFRRDNTVWKNACEGS